MDASINEYMTTNAFTIDLEDWYQGIELPFSEWDKYNSRLEIGLNNVLQSLDKYSAKATFFALGWIAEKHPDLIKTISQLGHEFGSHGFSHEKVYDQTPEKFRDEIRRTKNILEDITGNEVVSHRSPFFSVTGKSLWALDILAEEGYKIDCSISPIKTWRYGIANCPDEIFRVAENNLIEFPVSKFKFLTKNWAIGGAYFRLFPYLFTANGLRQRTKKGLFNMFYAHPWEYDPEHPRVKFERKAMFTHYTNLKKMIPNTEKLLKNFSFDTVSKVVKNYEQQNRIKQISIKVLQD